MSSLKQSVPYWKFFIIVQGMIFSAAIVWAGCYWERSVIPEMSGTLGMEFGMAEPGPAFPITQLISDSSGVKQGLIVGDSIIFDQAGDRYRIFGADESIGMTIVGQGKSRHVVVKTTPVTEIRWIAKAYFFILMTTLILALIFGLLIGLRKPESMSARMLALVMLSTAPDSLYLLLPGGVIQTFEATVLHGAAVFTEYVAFLICTMYFPHDDPARQPRWMRRILPYYLTIFGIYLLGVSLFRLGYPSPAEQVFAYFKRGLAIVSIVFSFSCLLYSYRSSSGEMRGRVRWIAFSIGPIYCTYFLFNFWNGSYSNDIFGIFQYSVILLSLFGLAYATLRVHIFDFYFVINRALVFGAVSLLLLTSFGLIEWASEHLIHFEQREKSVLLDGGIALAVYLAFHRVRHSVEHFVEQVFFRKWHNNEETLRRFVRHASHITALKPLLDGYTLALQAFIGRPGCAIYQTLPNGGYVCLSSTISNAPPQLNVNDALVVEMRADHLPIFKHDRHASFSFDLALPMLHRGDLRGFILLEAKANNESYRPDELEVLTYTAHQIGLNLDGLQIEALKAEGDALLKNHALTELKILELQATIGQLQIAFGQVGGLTVGLNVDSR